MPEGPFSRDAGHMQTAWMGEREERRLRAVSDKYRGWLNFTQAQDQLKRRYLHDLNST